MEKSQDRTLIIGVAGGSGSGKTTFARKIAEEFKDDVLLLSHDSYYKKHDDMSFDARSRINYDHPDAFDTELLIRHIKKLLGGESVETPVYDFALHNRSKETILAKPAKIIVIDGILIFENRELRELMDIKIFIDTQADIRLLRRIRRDMKKRGRSLDSIIEQYLDTVRPMHELFVEPSRKYADVIVPEGGKNPAALSLVFGMIYRYLGK